MSDSFTEVTRTSWFSRIGRSIVGVLVGIVLLIAMVVLLFWNEGRAVTTARSLAEGAGIVVSVPADSVDAANQGKLIHVTGEVKTNETPSDAAFAISAPGVRLERKVEMYQWRQESKSETKTQVGGGQETVVTYTYSKAWEDRAIDSSDFKQPAGHANPPMEITSRSFQVQQATLGGFTLDKDVIDRIGGERSLQISSERLTDIEKAYGGSKKVSVVDNRIYLGFNPTSPAIGDYRIAYDVAPAATTSIVGRQDGNGFAAYQTEAGDALLMVRAGALDAAKMFADAEAENTIITWVIRVAGIIGLFIGFFLLLAPLGVMGDVIPFIGRLIRFGTGLIAFILALLVGGGVIAIAWFWYRPLLSLAIFGGAVLIAFGLSYIGKARAAKAPAPQAA